MLVARRVAARGLTARRLTTWRRALTLAAAGLAVAALGLRGIAVGRAPMTLLIAVSALARWLGRRIVLRIGRRGVGVGAAAGRWRQVAVAILREHGMCRESQSEKRNESESLHTSHARPMS